jgi:RND superfamily putative drug exporter
MLDRLARTVSAHPRRVAVLALAVFVVSAVFGASAPGKLDAERGFDDPGSQATKARKAIERATGREAAPGVLVLVKAPPSSAKVAAVVRGLKATQGIADVVAPSADAGAGSTGSASGASPLVSRDGRETLVTATLRADAASHGVVDDITDRFAGDPDVELGGDLVAGRQVGEQASRDLGSGELLAFPLLALLAWLVFRGVAALLPVAVGATAVLAAFALLRAVDAAIELSPFALNLVIGLGLGLAIDYSLICVSRFREELGRGASVPDAVRTMLTTAGRTVLFSAATVAAASACLTVFPQRFLISMGLGGAIVAIVAALATLLLVPCLCVLLGRRLGKVVPGPVEEGRWYRLTHRVLRRPALVAAVTAAALLLVAAPTLSVQWTGVDATILPTQLSARTVADTVARDFPAADTTRLAVVVKAPTPNPADAAVTTPAALRAYAARLARVLGVASVSAPRAVGAGTWQIDVAARGMPTGAVAQRAVDDVRAVAAPSARLVGGAAADLRDQQAAVSRRLPLAFGLLAVVTLSILWLMTGSVVLPIKALIMNLLTVAAATGLMVLVFQHGVGVGLLGASQQPGIEQTDYLVFVAIVFGLSTDYGVFLLSRIKELREQGLDDREAIAVGLQRTGAIVSAAALLLAVALGAFVLGDMVFLKELGFGAAMAVLIDAFVVRALLVPALMGLLGAANWWSPAPLRRLHDRLGIREGPAPA